MMPAFSSTFQPGPYKLSFERFAGPGLLGLCALVLIAFVLRLVDANFRGVLNLDTVVSLGHGWCMGNGSWMQA